jgi:hypothetical protein
MRLRRGQVVKVVFLDHCIGNTTEPMQFVVYGRVAKISKDSLTIASWDYYPCHKETPPNLSDSNRTTYVILRAAIKSITHLKEV